MVSNAARRLAWAASQLELCAETVAACGRVVGDALKLGNQVLVCGNGGSAASAQHFSAELSGKLAKDRAPFPGLALTVDTSALLAIANDWSFEEVFARQVSAYGRPGDVLIALSTSGTSANVRRAVEVANASAMTTIALTGPTSELGAQMDVNVALKETARVQEIHDLILHEITQIAERVAVSDLDDDASADRFGFVLPVQSLSEYRVWTREAGSVLVTTNGVFDLLHEGHLASLAQARTYGDQLVVLINTDASVRRIKGPTRPVCSEAERVRSLAQTKVVDHVVMMDDDSPEAILAQLAPDVHCKGEEYATRPMPERTTVETCGGRVVLLPLMSGVSTTSLIERVQL